MDDIKQKTITSTIWKFLERFMAQAISLIVSILLARLLDPSDYSVVGIVTIFFTFANVLISGGLNTALIQKKDADNEDYSTVLYVSILLSIICYAILFFCAPLIAQLYDQPSLVLIIRVMGLSLPITAVKSIWCAYISATLQFRKFFFATLGGTLVSAVVGITMALNGFGPWALVAQQMTNTVIDTLILIVSTRIHIVLKVSITKLKVLFKYGWKVFVSSIIGVVYMETAPLAIGVKFTPNDLSYYTKGKSFPNLLSSTTTNTLSAVLFPVLARSQDDKPKLLAYTRRYMQVASFIIFPVMLGFFAVAENFVLVFLTEKWLPAVYYIQVYCIVSMFDVVAVGNCETIKAIGRSDVYLIMEIIKKSCYFLILVLFIVFSNTPEIMAISSIVCTLVQILVNSIPNIKLIGYKFGQQIMDLLPNLIMALIMMIAAYVIKYVPIPPLASLCLQMASGIVVYIGLSVVTSNKNFKYIWQTVKGFLGRRDSRANVQKN